MSAATTPRESALRHRVLLAVTLCCSVVAALVMVEILLRAYGLRPAKAFHDYRPDEPATNVPDPVLGWRAKPGSYRIPPFTPDASPITMTIWSDGSRATGTRRVERSRQVVLIGDSFTQGWAISDEETYAWKLQARFPGVEVVKYGTAGYNGVQSLLRLQQHLADHARPPELVIYGFNDDQERRNVAENSWAALLAFAARREMVRLPYCLPDGRGGLTLYPPFGFPTWPFRGHLAIVPVLEKAAFRIATHGRTPQQRRATELLIERLAAVIRERGSRLLVAVLFGESEIATHYTDYLGARGIDVVDCRIPGPWSALRVPGEGHPNGIANDKWTDCLAPVLAQRLAQESELLDRSETRR